MESFYDVKYWNVNYYVKCLSENCFLFTIKSKTAILRRITGYEEVLELWLGMSLNYYYLTSKDYLAIILDNPYGKIKEAALIWVQNYGTST